jgi:hypothetical protein
MGLIFFANDTTYSGSTVNIVTDTQWTNPATNTSNSVRAMFILKALLKTCGWTVKSSGDGVSTFGTGSDVITQGTGSNSTTNGANSTGDFLNGGAWFYIQSPGTSSQHFVIQRNTGTYANTTQGWRIKYSTTGFFTSGMSGSTGLTGSASKTPTAISASDESILFGGGTDASPTFLTFGPANFAATKVHMAAQNTEPYGFWQVGYSAGSDPVNNGWFFVHDPILSGTFPGLDQPTPDQSPYVCGIWASLATWTDMTNQLSMQGAFLKGLATAGDDYLPQPTIVHWGALTYNLGNNGTALVPQGVGINPLTQKVDLLPIWYARRSNPAGNQITLGQSGIKGCSSLMRFPVFNLTNGEVFDYNGVRDKVCFGYLVFDWDGSDFVST